MPVCTHGRKCTKNTDRIGRLYGGHLELLRGQQDKLVAVSLRRLRPERVGNDHRGRPGGHAGRRLGGKLASACENDSKNDTHVRQLGVVSISYFDTMHHGLKLAL